MLQTSGELGLNMKSLGFLHLFNFRFNVAKTLQHIASILPNTTTQVQVWNSKQGLLDLKLNMNSFQTQVRPCIEKLNNDSDFDVRYYASEAAMGMLIKFNISFFN